MLKKIFTMISLLFLSTLVFATTWEYEGGLDGEAGLMIVYKTLPPLIVEVDEPEMMIVPRGNQTFRYSEVTRSKQPLNVKIEIHFNDNITNNNGINKEIVRTIYDTARLSFLSDGKFKLQKVDSGKLPRKIESKAIGHGIDGEAIFTNEHAVLEAIGRGKIITRQIGDSIKNGTLHRSDIYIDAIFNKERQEMVSGQYEGSVTLEVEFLGKGVR